jgi:hypothetical protein
VRDLLGHSTTRETEVYMHHATSHLREAVEALSDRFPLLEAPVRLQWTPFVA